VEPNAEPSEPNPARDPDGEIERRDVPVRGPPSGAGPAVVGRDPPG